MSIPIEKFHLIDEIYPSNPNKPFTKTIINDDEVMSVNPGSAWKVDRIYTDYTPKNEHKELIVVFKRKEKTVCDEH